MNVFVLCTGRCGSVTFAKAANHADNFTVGHESRIGMMGERRLDYPDNHIEIDNRLSWFLGRLHERYPDAFYVHLRRDLETTALSFAKRFNPGQIMPAYLTGIYQGIERIGVYDVALDYCETVTANIRAFLKYQPSRVTVDLESAKEGFRRFWKVAGLEGDLESALETWDVKHNASVAA